MKRQLVLALIQVFLLGAGSSAASTPTPALPQSVPGRLTESAGWRWPVKGEPKILDPFDKPEQRWAAGHRGIDLAADEGDEVLAPHRGRVTFRSTVVDRPVIVIDHGAGFKTSIEPAASDLEVGAWIEAGAKIGTVANGAHCSQRCIHWGVRLNGEYIDPALLIKDLRPSILLPLN
ncbi:M23 family metallopeptidase [Glutamicibacter sp.]|uniref:M23 family metallopeptidase n=1 Tax=Glutamicibacter sp. TaxID=1931995 RepID=UPI0028BD5B21|nr:M23 family metallopeptidase [Glutamicibacter sp.]